MNILQNKTLTLTSKAFRRLATTITSSSKNDSKYSSKMQVIQRLEKGVLVANLRPLWELVDNYRTWFDSLFIRDWRVIILQAKPPFVF